MKQIFAIFCIIFTFALTGCTRNNLNNMKSGYEAFNQKDYVSAIKYYKKEIKKNPQNAQAYSQYCGAECYAYDKNKKINLNNTLFFCNKSLELDSNIAETYFYKGRIYDQLEKNKEAIQEYSNAIKIDSNYEKAYLNRGICESKLGMIKEAISDYSKAIELKNEGDLLLALYNRGFAYLQIKEKEKADSDFKKVANFDIKNATAQDFALKGRAKNELNDYVGAIYDFTKAIELDNTKIEYYIFLALLQGRIMNFDGAIETCSKGIDKFKNNTELLYAIRGFSIGSKELLNLPYKKNVHKFSEASSDFKKAQELAVKNNNSEDYKQIIDLQKSLQEIQIKTSSTSSNISFSLDGVNAKKTITTKNGHTTIRYTTRNSNDFISKEGILQGIYSDDIRIKKNKTLVIRGSMSGDIEVENGATLINYGNISGDINNNGHVVNNGNISGDINNKGILEIYGINTGDINTNKNIYIDKNAIVNGKINRF